jgi:glycosyltransferase involved in cell wall biosynthesis
MRLILIINIISPHRIPIFNHIDKITDIDFKVIFLAETEGSRQWRIYKDEMNFDYQVLRNISFYIQSKEMPIYFNWGLSREFRKFKPDAICQSGYQFLASIEALLYAKLKGIPITLWAGSHLSSGFVKNPLAEFYKKTIIPRFDSYVTYGTAAREQIIHYGANPEKIVVGCNTVDVGWFTKRSGKIREGEIKEMKKKYPSKNILYVGDFIERKGVINLIKSFEKLNMKDVGLILVGNGKEKDEYYKYIKEHNIDNIFFEGFVQKEELVKYYKLADVFVLPSLNEVWGLVVNEAMACSLPVICSKVAGAGKDLIKEGINGYLFDPFNINDLTDKLKAILYNDENKKVMGENSLVIIRDKTPESFAKKLLEAVEIE